MYAHLCMNDQEVDLRYRWAGQKANTGKKAHLKDIARLVLF
jgi:hypothetical protein